MTGLTNYEICIPTSIQARARGGAQPTIAPKRETEELRASAVKKRVYHDWTHRLRDMHPNIDVDAAAKRIMRDEWLITRAELELRNISHHFIAREFAVVHRQRACHVNGSGLSKKESHAHVPIGADQIS